MEVFASLALGIVSVRSHCPFAKEIERNLNFDNIESPEDVMLWMASGLPDALYNSSTALAGDLRCSRPGERLKWSESAESYELPCATPRPEG